jgi:hypothetical protein
MRRVATSLYTRSYFCLFGLTVTAALAAGCGSSEVVPPGVDTGAVARDGAVAQPVDAMPAPDTAVDAGVSIGVTPDGAAPEAAVDTGEADAAAADVGDDVVGEPDGGADAAADSAPVSGPLVGYWPLDEAAGTTTADLSGHGGTGTLTGGAAWVTPGFPAATFANPAAVMLDGIDDDVELAVTALPRIEAPKSVSVWFYLQAPAGAGRQNIVALTNFPMNAGIQVGLQDGRPTAWFMDDPAPAVIADAVAAAGWHHVAYTYDGTTHRLYVDNVLAPTGTKPSPVAAPVATAWLGTFDLKIELFAGRVDDVRIYDQPLDAAAVAALSMGRVP